MGHWPLGAVQQAVNNIDILSSDKVDRVIVIAIVGQVMYSAFIRAFWLKTAACCGYKEG